MSADISATFLNPTAHLCIPFGCGNSNFRGVGIYHATAAGLCMLLQRDNSTILQEKPEVFSLLNLSNKVQAHALT